MKEKSECLFSQNHFPILRLFFPVICLGAAGLFCRLCQFLLPHISFLFVWFTIAALYFVWFSIIFVVFLVGLHLVVVVNFFH